MIKRKQFNPLVLNNKKNCITHENTKYDKNSHKECKFITKDKQKKESILERDFDDDSLEKVNDLDLKNMIAMILEVQTVIFKFIKKYFKKG